VKVVEEAQERDVAARVRLADLTASLILLRNEIEDAQAECRLANAAYQEALRRMRRDTVCPVKQDS
jgi:hypothetical protein